MDIQLNVDLVRAEEVAAELKAQEDKGPVLPDVGGVPCYDISDSAAKTIAALYGKRDVPGHAYLWKLGVGESVRPEYVHDDIDHIFMAERAETDPEFVRPLTFLKGWLYLQMHNALPEPMREVPEEDRLKLSSISVRDLLGRYVVNRNGREFKLTDIRYDLKLGRVTFELSDLDENGDVIPDSESGLFDLDTFTVL